MIRAGLPELANGSAISEKDSSCGNRPEAVATAAPTLAAAPVATTAPSSTGRAVLVTACLVGKAVGLRELG